MLCLTLACSSFSNKSSVPAFHQIKLLTVFMNKREKNNIKQKLKSIKISRLVIEYISGFLFEKDISSRYTKGQLLKKHLVVDARRLSYSFPLFNVLYHPLLLTFLSARGPFFFYHQQLLPFIPLLLFIFIFLISFFLLFLVFTRFYLNYTSACLRFFHQM